MVFVDREEKQPLLDVSWACSKGTWRISSNSALTKVIKERDLAYFELNSYQYEILVFERQRLFEMFLWIVLMP